MILNDLEGGGTIKDNKYKICEHAKSTDINSLLQLISTCEIDTQK